MVQICIYKCKGSEYVFLFSFLVPYFPCICNILALQPLIWIVLATFWYFKGSCGFPVSFFRLHLGFRFGVYIQGLHMVSLGFHSGFHLMFHLNFFRFRISLELHLGFHWRVSFKVSLGLGFRQNVTNYKGFLIGISYHDFHSSCGFFYMRLL